MLQEVLHRGIHVSIAFGSVLHAVLGCKECDLGGLGFLVPGFSIGGE